MLTREEVESVVAAVEGRERLGRLAEARRKQVRPGDAVSLIAPSLACGKLEVAEATWGFDVEWGKGPVFNTRIESAISGSGMWSDLIDEGRCVIPASSFFEPHSTEVVRSFRTGRPVKRAYRFAQPSGEPLLLAGVWEEGRCSVVTCEPNRWVAPVHNRMPLVLRFEEVTTWLSSDWPLLADRSAFELDVRPEFPDQPALPEQLSLF